MIEMYAKMARQGHGFITSRDVRVIKVARKGETSLNEPTDVAKDGKEVGEIIFSGNITTPRYHLDSMATEKLLQGGALHSGDLAVWHPDGSIQILDRAKDIIISGGENISSVALEGMLTMHPAILEVAVVGVLDAKFGERPMAYATLKGGWEEVPSIGESGKAITGPEIVAWAKKGGGGISGFMVPREVVIVKELPKTSTGKVRKHVLRQWAQSSGGRREMH